MDANTEYLNYIYQNAEMGVETIRQILEIIEDSDFSKHLQTQLKEYTEINCEAKKKLNEAGHEEKDIGNMQKVMAYMSISMKTLTDKSISHISEMMIKGSAMGIIEATKNIRIYADADKDIVALAKKLLKTEENNFERLKKYL